ncbi:hypothetical protein ACJBSR_11280, partial [Streptococcus suis]
MNTTMTANEFSHGQTTEEIVEMMYQQTLHTLQTNPQIQRESGTAPYATERVEYLSKEESNGEMLLELYQTAQL